MSFVFPRYDKTHINLISVWTNRFRTAVLVFAIAVYLTVTIPALQAVVNPAEADPEFTFDQNLGLLGAGNTIIAGLLVLVLVMQARQTVVDNAEGVTESVLCSGWTRVREARGSKGVGCDREGKDQGCQVGVNSRYVVPYARNLLLSSSLLPIFVACGSSPMHSRSDPVQRLLSWCSSKRIHIDERLAIIQDEIRGEISVFNLSEETIPVSQTCKCLNYVRNLLIF